MLPSVRLEQLILDVRKMAKCKIIYIRKITEKRNIDFELKHKLKFIEIIFFIFNPSSSTFSPLFYYVLLQNPFRSAPVVVAIESKRVTFPLQVRHSLDNHFVLFLAKSHTFFLSQLNMCCCSLLLSAFLSLDLFSLCMIFRKRNQLSLTFLKIPVTYWFYYLSVIVDISTRC